MEFRHWNISGRCWCVFTLGMFILIPCFIMYNQLDIRISTTKAKKTQLRNQSASTVGPSNHILELRDILPKTIQTSNSPLIIYENCSSKIPRAPDGTIWPEEKYIYDNEVKDVEQMANPKFSKIWIEGSGVAKIGDKVKLRVQLYNGYGVMKKTGGDLIRVWMKEPSLGANTVANVQDNNDGSYSAIFTAFWEGRPEITAAIISPREAISIAFKRRYIYPPTDVNLAVFKHPFDTNIKEETACNFDNYVSGYSQLCNLTEMNFGSPWYCGKPRNTALQCKDWALTSILYLYDHHDEQRALSSMAMDIMQLKYRAMKIPSKLALTIKRDSKNNTVYIPRVKCNELSKPASWDSTSPTGFFFRKNWTPRNCRKTIDSVELRSCLKNTELILTGDSTTRQFFYQMEELITCKWVTQHWSKIGKHHPATCVNSMLNFTLRWVPHALPFCTFNSPRQLFKSFNTILNNVNTHSRTIILLHLYAHILTYHSHAFYETLKDTKKGVVSLLERNPNAHIVIKGPHAYSFAKVRKQPLWMPDAYASVYQEMIYNEFKDINDRVVYLECMDMTVSTEQWHIHAERYIINQMVMTMFNRICR